MKNYVSFYGYFIMENFMFFCWNFWCNFCYQKSSWNKFWAFSIIKNQASFYQIFDKLFMHVTLFLWRISIFYSISTELRFAFSIDCRWRVIFEQTFGELNDCLSEKFMKVLSIFSHSRVLLIDGLKISNWKCSLKLV
jgi:hypothetical protein